MKKLSILDKIFIISAVIPWFCVLWTLVFGQLFWIIPFFILAYYIRIHWLALIVLIFFLIHKLITGNNRITSVLCFILAILSYILLIYYDVNSVMFKLLPD